jgi:hypothetical protein
MRKLFNLDTLDTSVLDRRVTMKDWPSRRWWKWTIYGIELFFGPLQIAFIAGIINRAMTNADFIFYRSEPSEATAFFVVIIFTYIVPAAALITIYYLACIKARTTRFLADNPWLVEYAATDSRNILSTGVYGGVKFSERASLHFYKTANIKMSRNAPSLILTPNLLTQKNMRKSIFAQEIELEGKFGKEFSLFTPVKRRIDALQIITPDVMQTILQHGKAYSYELSGDRLYIHSSDSVFKSGKTLRDFLTASEHIAPQFEHQIKHYHASGQKMAIVASSANSKRRVSSFRQRSLVRRLLSEDALAFWGTLALLLVLAPIFYFSGAWDRPGTSLSEYIDVLVIFLLIALVLSLGSSVKIVRGWKSNRQQRKRMGIWK